MKSGLLSLNPETVRRAYPNLPEGLGLYDSLSEVNEAQIEELEKARNEVSVLFDSQDSGPPQQPGGLP